MSAPESSVQLPHVVQRVVLVDEPSSFSSLCATTLITSPILVPQQHVHLIEPVKAGEMPAETDARAQLHDAQITADIMFEGLRRRRSSSYPGLPNQYYVGNMLPTLQEVEEMRARLHLHALMPKQPATFAIHVSTDVMMMVLDAHQLPQVEAAWLRVQQLANMVPPTQSPHLILLADDPCRRVLATHMKELVERLQNWNIIFVWAHAFAPPAIDYGLTESSVRSPCGLRNLMSSLCAGVATGIISDFPTARLDPAWLVPLDIAMNVGLMAMAAHLRGLPLSPHGGGLLSPPSRGTTTTTTSSSSPPHINMHAVSVALPPQQSVVWGMISDYIIDYYGRHVSEIRRAFPEPSLIAHRPNLTFQLRLADALRGGLDSTHVVPCVDGLLTRHRRQHLLSAFPNSTTTRLLSELADNLDASVRDVVASIHAANTSSNTPGMVGVLSTVLATQRKKRGGRGNTREASIEALFSFDLESYLYLLRKISTNMNVVSWMPSVCLSDVDWDMYARVVARSSLLHLSEHVLRCDRPLQLPLTTRAHTNDIIFHGEDRTPAHPSRWRRLFGSVDWMVRCATMENGQLRVIEPGLTPKRLVSILAQPDIQRIITTISVEEGIPKEEVARRAEKIVLRIGDTMNQWSIRASGFMVRQVFFKIFDRIHINRGAFEKLFRYFHIPRVQIVLIPLHRSYMDFLLITYLLVVMGIPSPHIVSGEDFLKLGTFAAMLRGCGAFFMRRSFRGDPLYAGLFKEYVRQLVHHRQPLEFFIEGARSRTGKTMVPKLGILKFVTDAFFEGQKEVDDVLIIPMSLSYDKLLEAQIYAKELLGIPKPPESVPNMIRAFRSLNQRYGYVNMNVGEPISLRSFKEQNTTTTTATTTTTTAVVAARPSASTSHTPTALLTALGWRIAHDLQTNIIVTPSAVVAALVECSIPYLHVDAPARGLSLSRLYGMVAWLRHIIIMRGGIFNDAVMSWEAERLTTVGLHHLDRFVCVDGESRVNYVAPVLISTIGANMSTNQLIHLFMDDAVVCAVAHAYGNRVWSAAPHNNNNNNNRATSSSTEEDQRSTSFSSPAATVLQVKRDVLINASQLLRRLLSREFPDYTAACPIPHDTWLESAVRRLHSGKEEQRVLHESSATTAAHVAIPTTQLYYFVLQLIFPHVESIFLAMLTLHTLFEEMPGSVVAAKSATTVAHKAGVAMLERNLLDHHISVCREVVQHAMEVLVDLRMVRLDRSGSSGLSYALAGGDGDEERTHAMSRIFVLMEQVNALRWHPLGNLREDAAEMKAFIRTHYLEVVHRSKV